MKKFMIIMLAFVLVFTLGACGSKNDSDTGKGGGADATSAADKLLEEAISQNAFSVAAADAALKTRGISKSAVEPDWEYTIDEDKMQAYGDSSKGVIRFTKKDGYVSDEEYEAWLKKAFEATAKASDSGYNIEGFSFGSGDVEKTWDDFINNSGLIQTWSYTYKGTIMDVYVEEAKEKDSDYNQDASGNWVWTHYYNGVQIDVGAGLQKSFDETVEDIEKAFEEHGDEIEKAIKDYTE